MHSGKFDREYFCHTCHLQYAGESSAERGREACPNCGDTDPCAVDSFAHCYCWITKPEVRERTGRDPWMETAWWREEWMRPEWHAYYAEVRREPNPQALRYWKRREQAYARRLARALTKRPQLE